MRIAAFHSSDAGARVGLVVDDVNFDAKSVMVADLTGRLAGVSSPLDALELIREASGDVLGQEVRTARRLPVPMPDLLPPVPRPGKFLGIGFNYRAHAEEAGVPATSAPLFFNKQVTCITGPRADIWLPEGCTMLDYEGELALVIGRRCRDVPVARAHEVIGGWLACNDVSARDWQRESATVTLGKSHDGFGPIGPWLVSPDEIGDPRNLSIRTTVNGELRQDGCTADMIHDVFEQIAYVSSRCTLEVGDLITTGSPAGSAQGRRPQPWLQAGDVVRIDVEGVGTLENTVVPEARRAPVRDPADRAPVRAR